MKKLVAFNKVFAVFLACQLLSACSSDYLDLSTDYISGLCVIKHDGGMPVFLLNDEGMLLRPVSALDSLQYEDGTRFLVTYVIMDNEANTDPAMIVKNYSKSSTELTVKILEMLQIPVKDPVMRANLPDTVESNEVNLLRKPWYGGGFLNFEFSFRSDNSDIKHTVWLVCDSLTNENGLKKWYLSFLHDANDDVPNTTTSSLTSFTYSNIPQILTTDSLIIRVLTRKESDRSDFVTFRIKNE